MAKQQRILSCFLFSSLLCSALVTSDEVTRQTPVTILKSVRGWTQRGPDGVKIEPSTDGAPVTSNHPIRTPVAHVEARSPSAEACEVTAAPILNHYRRQVNDQAVTIVFLSSALASAHGNAVSLSQSLASSISQLQLSIDFLSSSASSAIRSLQASASRAIQAVEASASDVVDAAEESAASRVSEVLSSAVIITATGTGIPSNRTAYQAQILVTNREPSVPVAVVAGAVAASVAGSVLISVLGFYVFALRRKAKRQEEEERQEQKRTEEEVDVNAALDRAIVSYIAKESPSPITLNGQENVTGEMVGDTATNSPRHSFLAPPPRHINHHARPSAIATPASLPRSPPQALGSTAADTRRSPPVSPPLSAPPLGSSPLSPPPLSPPRRARRSTITSRSPGQPLLPLSAPSRKLSFSTMKSPPPGPPPTVPLPRLPLSGVARKSSRKKPSRSGSDIGGEKSDNLVRPLEPITSIDSAAAGGAESRPTGEVLHPERRDSNWPLKGGKRWL